MERFREDKEVVELTENYVKGIAEIENYIVDVKAKTARQWQNKVNNKIIEVVKVLDADNKQFSREALKDSFKDGQEETKDVMDDKTYGKPEKSATETLAEHDVAYNWQTQSKNTYIEFSTGLQEASKNTITSIEQGLKALEKTNNATVNNLRELVIDNFVKDGNTNKDGLMTVKYKNGAKVSIEAYANMVARTNRIESSNIGSVGQTVSMGIDLVKCTTVPTICEICTKYQGRVYSISGDDKRYPSLYDTAFSSGYSIIHPNCRHEFLPYIEELETPKTLKKDRDFSNRSFDKDYRKKRERDAYNANQRFNRQYIEEYRRYQDMKMELKDDFPWKSLGSFRRSKRSNSPLYQEWNKKYLELNKTKVLTKEPEEVIIEEDIIITEEFNTLYDEEERQEIQDTVSKAPKFARDLWNKNIVDVKIEKIEGIMHADTDTGVVFVNKKYENETSKKYGIDKNTSLYHELGHAFEINSAKKDPYNEKWTVKYNVPSFYEGGLYEKTLKKEFEIFRKEYLKIYNPEIQKTKSEMKNKEIENKEISKLLKEDKKYKEFYKYSGFLDIINGASWSETIEGNELAGINTQIGHPVGYWSDVPFEIEAFAEMYSATMTNLEDLAEIKKVFPESYKVFQEMVVRATKREVF